MLFRYKFILPFIYLFSLTIIPTTLFTQEKNENIVGENKPNQQNNQEKKNSEKKSDTNMIEEDPLLNPRELFIGDVYPREDLVVTPEFLLAAKTSVDFLLKPYFHIGSPLMPLFDYYEKAGMDLFSGKILLSLGTQIKNPWLEFAPFEIEINYTSFASSEYSGLRNLSKGKISGTTKQYNIAFFAGIVFFISENFYFSIGLGGADTIFEYSFSEKKYLSNGEEKSVEDGSISKFTSAIKTSFGVNIPIYSRLHAQFFSDYQMLIYSDTFAAHLGLGSGISWNF